MVLITLIDGQTLEINEDTVLNGYKATAADSDTEFYLNQLYSNSINGKLSFNKEASALNTAIPMVGIAGFIGSVDYFSIGLDTDNAVLYKATAVKSVQNM
ncbi:MULTISPECIES: hypothetical protein [Peribacillus]|uniref:Uncharacterized protein n=1 Tax=Peribacillus frigoritolerans TaxID=450367 RepID=A0AAJ1QLM4_9BACI|nr:hypothetical protein [Peribacillus frigoritolerans]MDM5283794.1 hypothetical protein [Peribacillus frigoritolerans]